MKLIHAPLISFGGECLIPLGSIDLSVTTREPAHRATKMVSFLVMEHPSVYNVILGKPSFNIFLAITSTYLLMVMFPLETRIRVLRANQEEFSKCYATILKGKIDKQVSLQVTLDHRDERNE